MAFNKITNADLVGKGVTGLPDVPGLSTGAMQAKFDELSLDVIVPAYNALIDLLNGTGVADNSQITDPTDSVVKSLQALANSLKTYIDTRDATKADKATTLAGYGVTDAYTKTQTDTALATKADIASSLAGYGILDAYTKVQTDNLLAGKADNGTTLGDYGITDAYTKTETYSKTQADNLLATKVDEVSGKGLSTNDYDNTEKSANTANTAARHTHSNKTTLDAITASTKAGYDALVTLLNGIIAVEQTITNDQTKIPTGAAVVAYVQSLGGGDMLKAVYDTNNDGIVDNSSHLGNQLPAYYTNSENHSYDNTTSGLSASTTKAAIDELAKPTFTEAETRTNIASGESIKTILGKIKKFFTDLKTVAFTGAYSDLSGTPSTLNPTDNAVPANGNLDDCTTVGFYSCTGGNSVTNKPSGVGHFGLIVTHSASGGQWMQILTDSGNGKTFVRYRGASGWSTWESVALTSDIQSVVLTTDVSVNANSTTNYDFANHASYPSDVGTILMTAPFISYYYNSAPVPALAKGSTNIAVANYTSSSVKYQIQMNILYKRA